MTSRITKELFGKTNEGNEVYKFTQVNKNGLVLETTSYGAIVLAIKCPDKNGKIDDITLGFDDFEAYYRRNTHYFGSTVGRVCNRIANGQFEIDGKSHRLAINDPPNCNHGGLRGFDKHVWDYQVNDDSVTFSRTSPDGEEGFSGNLSIQVTYGLNDANELHFIISATSDSPTPINICSHPYFNLAGQTDADILKHVAHITAEFYIPTNEINVPTGEIFPVKEAPAFDFRKPKEFGKDIEKTPNKGYDYTFCLPESRDITTSIARVTEPVSGRWLEVCTSQPGIHLYTANGVDGSLAGKSGIFYKKYGAFCLETQNYPDAIHHIWRGEGVDWTENVWKEDEHSGTHKAQ